MKLKYINEKDIRIDKWISSHPGFKDISRTYVKKMILDGNIVVNNKKIQASYKLSKNDLIEISITKPEVLDVKKQAIPIDIVYEDNDVLVVNKKRGMVVHPGNGNNDGTLVNAIMYHCQNSLSDINGTIRPGIVHRIDKDTSGLLVIAKNNFSHNFLAKQFKKHTICREYCAVCTGVLKYNKIKIDKPIGRSKNNRIKFDIDTISGKKAVTHVEVIERFSNATFISAKLETGRTHQIRVHLESIGHPLIGDPLYYKPSEYISGQALHARKLGFIHPTTKNYVEFKKDLPEDFKTLLNNL